MARQRVLLMAAGLLGVGIAFPIGVIAAHQFGDVPNANPYHADIDAIADAGVTTGCGGGNYCPSDVVTREQMAAFMNRLGALGPGKVPVVNAAKVDGHDNVLPAGDIVVDQLGPWSAHPASTVSVASFPAFTAIYRDDPGAVSILLLLRAPGTIGGVTYGLSSVEICYGEPLWDVDITRTTVEQVIGIHNSELVIDDETDRDLGLADCYTVVDASPSAPTGASTLVLDVTLGDTLFPEEDTFVHLGNTRSTWTPVN